MASSVKPYSIGGAVGIAVGLVGLGFQWKYPDQGWLGKWVAIGGLALLVVTIIAYISRWHTIREYERTHPLITPSPGSQHLSQKATISPVFAPVIAPVFHQTQTQQQVQTQKTEQRKQKQQEVGRPNLIDRGVRVRRAHQDLWAQVLVEGPNDNRYGGFDPDWQVLAIEVCNEFRVSPKTAPVSNVTAEIIYSLPDGTNFKLNRGAWLGGANRIGFNVNDYRHLIIIGSLMRTPSEARIFVKEYPRVSGGMDSFINLDALMGTPPADHDYPVEIRLISESEGKHYATFNYMLSIGADEGQGPVSLDLIKASDWEAFKKDRAEGIKAQKGDV
ncbi:MAG: hypothetical protein QOH41_1149 [Blastocatellia bacterium]|jgi:hypothetical protein|nr:hypothetical protein [Blastocatellia bacterium]